MTKRFSASSAAQLMACPGSANLDLAIPGWIEPVRDDTVGAKAVGTNVHEVLEPFAYCSPAALRLRASLVLQYSKLYITRRKAIVDTELEARLWLFGSPMANILPSAEAELLDWFMLLGQGGFTPKMLRFIADAAGYMAGVKASMGSTESIVAEYGMEAQWLPSGPKTTADVILFGRTRLEVFDYKSGAIKVSPVDNDQLLFYAACVYSLFNTKPQEFTLHILQPGNLDSWTAPIEHLERWMRKAVQADQKILDGDLTLRPSDHCTFCPANPHSRGDKGRPFCPAMMNKLYPPVIDEDEIFAVL